jgi:hypothetical protein
MVSLKFAFCAICSAGPVFAEVSNAHRLPCIFSVRKLWLSSSRTRRTLPRAFANRSRARHARSVLALAPKGPESRTEREGGRSRYVLAQYSLCHGDNGRRAASHQGGALLRRAEFR